MMNQKHEAHPVRKRFIGDPRLALDVARRAAGEVPAYARLLKEAGLFKDLLSGKCALEDLPLTDKDSYCLTNAPAALMASSLREKVNGFFSSSGSSGRPFRWPRLKGISHSLSLSGWLEDTFSVSQKKTLAVVALNMDGWSAGMNTALAMNQFAFEAPFQFMVCSPGSDYEQALRTIAEVHAQVEQVVVFIYPAAIRYFLGLAADLGVDLPLSKLRFAATGDPFTEEFRYYLDKLCSAAWPTTALASYSYSSADTRGIGTEHRVSRALARLLSRDERLRRAFGLGETLPNIYVSVPAEETPLIEDVAGELAFTRWQPVPLVRYNLHDKGELWDWAAARDLVLRSELPAELEPLREEFARQKSAPGDLIALYGRSKALYFYGLYIDEQSFSKVIAAKELQPFFTGMFHVALAGDPGAPRLVWDIEVKKGSPAAAALDPLFYRVLLGGLMEIFPHFGVNYRNFLIQWDSDPEKRIFRLNFHVYPELSGKWRNSRKHMIIRAPETAVRVKQGTT